MKMIFILFIMWFKLFFCGSSYFSSNLQNYLVIIKGFHFVFLCRQTIYKLIPIKVISHLRSDFMVMISCAKIFEGLGN
jgi:hypothetical protein